MITGAVLCSSEQQQFIIFIGKQEQGLILLIRQPQQLRRLLFLRRKL